MSDGDRLVEQIRKELGSDQEVWIAPTGYDSVALAIIDSVFSIGTHYSGVVNAVNRYRAARREEGAEPDADSAADLVEAVGRWGVDGLVERTNKWRTSTRAGAPLKAEVVHQVARILAGHGLGTVEAVRAGLTDPQAQQAAAARKEWLALPGQASGLAWGYFLMLCGVPGVKADRMVVRYVTRAVGASVEAKEASALVAAAADVLGVSSTRLDHAIWRLESGRPVEYAAAP
ncbi:heme peroxidase [Georgenia satyanarayanai]|uniref:heme peroxidase n=1 Tax=Georgenia satyanarayanai TaxID=860221 RepID=UPI00186B1609|nr:heme peroxidase [Georgenia satyanarayanai]